MSLIYGRQLQARVSRFSVDTNTVLDLVDLWVLTIFMLESKLGTPTVTLKLLLHITRLGTLVRNTLIATTRDSSTAIRTVPDIINDTSTTTLAVPQGILAFLCHLVVRQDRAVVIVRRLVDDILIIA